MNHKNNIESYQQKISQFSQIDPPDFVWSNIEKHLDKKQRRMPIWIWLISVILGGIALFTFISKADQTTVASSNQNKLNNSSLKIEDGTPTSQNEPPKVTPDILSKTNQSNGVGQNHPSKTVMDIKHTSSTMKKSNQYQVALTNRLIEDNSSIILAPELTKEIRQFSTINGLYCDYNSTHCESIQTTRIAPKDDIVCHDFKSKKGTKYYIEPGLTLGRPIKSISGNAPYTHLLDLRKQTENAWYSWGGYLHAGILFKNGLYAGLGVDYLQSKERFILISEAITKMIINFDPQTGLPIDTSFVSGNLVNKGEIRYNSVDIPVLIGYLTHHKVWNFGIEMAARYNIHFDAQGKTYNQNLDISRIENESSMYKSSLGWSGKANFILSYNFDKSTQLLIKPYYFWQFNPIDEPTYPITTTWSSTGFEFGLKKIL